MPRQTEPSANNALGGLLQVMMPKSQVRSENTRAIAGHPGLRPDILITASDRAPVVVEAEYMPAATVETEARERLGLEVAANGRIIEAAIALRYAESVSEAHDLRIALSGTALSYCVFTESTAEVIRFPESGWLEGSLDDLADTVRLVSMPQRAVDEAATTLQEGIDGAAKLLDEMNETRPSITAAIARLLGMSNVPQTRRMACAIIANALVFHERIAGMHQEVKPLAKVCGDGVLNPQGEVLAAWATILDINYWAIFAIAKDILEQLDSGDAARLLRRLRDTAQAVHAAGVDNAHDLTGRVFQRLIADRKYLATFYTLPSSAAFLARLAVAKMEGVDWSSAEAISKLRIGDFACGTGALAICGVRADSRPPRAGRGRRRCPPRGDDGGGPLRLRCHALRCPYYRRNPLRCGAVRPLQPIPPLHYALRPDEGRRRRDWLPGASPRHERDVSTEYQRPGSAHRERRGRDNHPSTGRHTPRKLRSSGL